MQQIQNAVKLLEEKKQLFSRYDEITNNLLTELDTSRIENYITERESLANKIDNLNSELAQQLAKYGELVAPLLAGRAEAGTLPKELAVVGELCGEIAQLVRRIRMRNDEAVAHCEAIRDESERKIRETSNMPKISRYLTGLTDIPSGNNFGSV